MSQTLGKLGIYFDELDKVRILDPDSSNQTNKLKDECKIYLEKIDEFQKLADSFIQMIDTLAQEVEKQKMIAIGARNILHTMEKQEELEQQQLHALINERSMEVERLKIYTNSLQRTEMEQTEILTRLLQN